MPKAASPAGRADPTPFKNNVHSLKRNQACHQCRKRKLKCDAKRPCSTCVRSHSYAQAHASPSDRLNLPEHPDCTFDDVSAPPPPQQTPPAPKSRYERLENRINELESLLRDKATAPSPSPPAASTSSPSADLTPISTSNDFGVLPSFEAVDDTRPSSHEVNTEDWSTAYFGSTANHDNSNANYSPFTHSASLDHLAGIATLLGTSPIIPPERASNSTPGSSHGHSGHSGHSVQLSMSPPADTASVLSPPQPLVSADRNTAIVYSSWPSELPDVTTTRHLVNAFFAHFVHAAYMFHAPSFFQSLALHPSDPHFPCRAVLHAMCAVGSLYTSSLSPQPAITDSYPFDAATGIRRKGKKRIVSFGDQHAKFAKEAIQEGLDQGERLFEHGQAQTILAWFFQSHARWVEACLTTAMAMRCTIPCGLNVCPPFHGIAATDPFSERQPSILPDAKTVVEDEMRRNTFWITYSLERQLAAGNGWAMLMDDRDIAQLLPLRHDQFMKGELVLPPARQWSHARDTLYVHPADQTDSFIMYIKCSFLISRIKHFNLRFKSLAFSGDPSVVPISDTSAEIGNFKGSPRTSPLFLELDNLILTFKNKFPSQLKMPLMDGKIDHYLYSAWNILHLSQIHLHEPYARPGSQSCLSAFKILTACRAIVNLLHTISSSSFDVSLLDIYPFTCWFMAGRVLVRFLKAAQDAQAHDQVVSLKSEIAFLHTMLQKAGERMPIAYTYAKMLENTAIATCGDIEPEEQPYHNRTSKSASVSSEYDYTAELFSYKTSPDPPLPTSEQVLLINQHTAMDASTPLMH